MRLATILLAAGVGAALAGCPQATPPPTAPLPTETGSAAPVATPSAPAVTPVDAARLEAKLTPYVESLGAKLGETRKMSGFLLITQHDVPVYAHAFGFADREHQTPNDADTNFRIASLTKQFTAAAILVLQQDGKLSVDDPIGKYLPDYPAVGRDITLHQLLTHTSGIPDYTQMPAFDELRQKPRTPAELLATFWSQPLVFPPGSQFAYSNSNYIVLGAIIEKVSGQRYGDFLAQRLFAPAGMTRTVVGDAEGMPNRALGYEPGPDGLVPATKIDMSVPFAAGSVRSTANDLVRWNRALAGDAILTAASKARYYKPEKEDYAYGLVVKQQDGHTIIAHDGGIEGFGAQYRRVPDQDLVVVVWSNNAGVRIPIGDVALAVALGGDPPPNAEPDVVPLDDAAAARTVGHYTLTDAGKQAAAANGVTSDMLATILSIDITRTGAHLFIKPVGQDELPLEALAPNKYLQIDAGIQVDVTFPDKGPATQLSMTQGPLVLPYVRDDPKPPAPPPARTSGKHK